MKAEVKVFRKLSNWQLVPILQTKEPHYRLEREYWFEIMGADIESIISKIENFWFVDFKHILEK